jgi:uncharacterized protein (DUF885 family)
MRNILSAIGLMATLLSASPARGQTPAPVAAGNRSLRALAEEFFAWRAVTQPATTDDVARVERPDGWVPDWSPATLGDMGTKLADFRRRFEALRPDGWVIPEKVDYLLLRSAIERVDWELNTLRSAHTSPKFYVDQTLGSVFELLLQPPPFSEARTRNLILRLESIPSTVRHARTNLTEGAAPFADVALGGLEHIAERLERTGREVVPLLSEGQRARFTAAVRQAGVALEEFAAWLHDKKPGMRPGVAVGRENYERYLKRIALLPYSGDELLQIADLEWNRSVAFEAYAKQRNSNLPPARLFRDSAEQIAATKIHEEGIRKFLAEKGIVDVPAWMGHYGNREIPAYLVALGYPGVFDDLTSASRLGQDSTSYIPEPSPNLAFWGRASAQDPRPLIVHEGVPGHFFQKALSWEQPDFIRRQYFDSGPIEGLGFYAEELMLQFGLFDDAPQSLDMLYRFMRLRALRVAADVKLARAEFSIDDAARYLAQTVPMDETTAREEAVFFASNPGQAITYQIGKAQIMKFLTDVRMHQGEKFNLKEFHNSLWKNGNVPIALQRWEALGTDDEVRKLW